MKQNHNITSQVLSDKLDKEFLKILTDEIKFHPEDKFSYLLSLARWSNQYELPNSQLSKAMLIEEKDLMYSLIIPNSNFFGYNGMVITYTFDLQMLEIDEYNQEYYGLYDNSCDVCTGYGQRSYVGTIIHIEKTHLSSFFNNPCGDLFSMISLNSLKDNSSKLNPLNDGILVAMISQNVINNMFYIGKEE